MKVTLIGGIAHGKSVDIEPNAKTVTVMDMSTSFQYRKKLLHYRERIFRNRMFDRNVFVLDSMDDKESLQLFLSTVYGPGL